MSAAQQERFTEVYVGHYADVLGYLLRRSATEDARDAAAEVFTVAWRRLGESPTGAATLPWLYRIAANVLANQRRSHRRRQNLGVRVAATQAPMVTSEDDHGFSVSMAAALDALSEDDREILLLNAWEGLPASQLALRFDISLKAAERRLTRARTRLAGELQPSECSDRPRPTGNSLERGTR